MSRSTDRLVEIMARLRDRERGCPWDVEQTFATIAPHTIEEAYEVADAIEHGDMAALKDELGDLLLQVVFHAQMAAEGGHFAMADVADAICDKLVRRHPHVFGDVRIDDAATQTRAWEDHKANERQAKAGDAGAGSSAIDGVAVGLPALTRALKLQKRAARVGFDWDEPRQVLDKFAEEIAELAAEIAGQAPRARIEDEVGDLLFNCVNLARKLDIDPEAALRRGNAKFDRRFRRMEELLAKRGRRPEESTLDEMEDLWRQAKLET
jgi:MazG family protein